MSQQQILLKDDFGGSGIFPLKGNTVSPNKLWRCIYDGFGSVGVIKTPEPKVQGNGNYCMSLTPKINNEFTSACLVLSEQSFGDIDAILYMRTFRQTKLNPENWETAWFMFRYVDNTHHYYFYINKKGILEIGKKDYVKVGTNQLKTPDGVVSTVNVQDKQVFLLTKPVEFIMKKWYKIRLIVKGFNIKIYIDGVLQADITDDGKTGKWLGNPVNFKPSPQLLNGKVGPYCEDAEMHLDNIVVSKAV